MNHPLSTPTSNPLTIHAHAILIRDLEDNGNVLSDTHKEALCALLDEMTGYLEGRVSGRRAFSLGTGTGKTSAIIAWLTALHRLGYDDVSVAVSASKVEALCDLKKALLAKGIHDSLIGLKHSHLTASLPSTGNDDRRYQLVTHARVRGQNDTPLFLEHRGKRRSLMIYDESLIRSDVEAIPIGLFREDVAALRERALSHGTPDIFERLLSYLESAKALIAEALADDDHQSGQAQVLQLPIIDDTERAGYTALLGSDIRMDTIRRFIAIASAPLRLIPTTQDDGLISYDIVVPDEISDVLILDASHPIRKLIHLDPTVTDATPDFVREVKRFDNVIVRQMNRASGRGALAASFAERDPMDRTYSQEVVNLVREIPTEKSILIFTFKPRLNEPDMPDMIRRDLARAGVDIHARDDQGRERISILTWGEETSLNAYSHCEVVILLGILHLSNLNAASRLVAQQDNLEAPVTNTDIQNILDGEVAHVAYQALSRGSCRVVEDGQSKPMEVYLFHKRKHLREALQSVMPGVRWSRWIPTVDTGRQTSKLDLCLMRLKQYLESLGADVMAIRTRDVKKALGLDPGKSSERKLFDRAINELVWLGEWQRQGTSLVRASVVFADEYA